MPFSCAAQHCVCGGLYILTNSGCYLKSTYSPRKLISHLISYSNEMGKPISCFSEVCACWLDSTATATATAQLSPGLSSPVPSLCWVISRFWSLRLFSQQLQAFLREWTAVGNTLLFQVPFRKLDSSRAEHLYRLMQTMPERHFQTLPGLGLFGLKGLWHYVVRHEHLSRVFALL